MHLEIFVKYLHFVCIFIIVSVIVVEHLLLKPEMNRKAISQLARIDGLYGMSAVLLLAAGFTLWFGVGKPAIFYSHNWIFHFKLGLFLCVGLLSIYPTVFFIKQRKGDPDEMVSIPKKIKILIRMELLLLFTIPLLAVLMAKGVGYFG